MQLMICMHLSGKTFPVDIEANGYLPSLFKEISQTHEIGVEQIRLLYGGKEYRCPDPATDGKTIAEIGFIERSTVQVVSRLPRGFYQRSRRCHDFREILSAFREVTGLPGDSFFFVSISIIH